jgi:hypothetical protein
MTMPLAIVTYMRFKVLRTMKMSMLVSWIVYMWELIKDNVFSLVFTYSQLTCHCINFAVQNLLYSLLFYGCSLFTYSPIHLYF